MKYKLIAVLLIVFLVLGCTGSEETREVKDCGSDEDCMMDAMITCEAAKCTMQYEEVDFLGSVETLSKEGDGCKYALNIETPKKARFTCIHTDSDSRVLSKDVCSNGKTLDETMNELMSEIKTPIDMCRQDCDALCSRYVDSNFDPREALAYCEKYFEIDLNRNGKIRGEVGSINAYGVSEDRVYCFNIKWCDRGSSKNNSLTPKKCRDIMCDVYTEKYKGNQTAAAALIKRKIPFGESTGTDHKDLIVVDGNGNPIVDSYGKILSSASWWIDNFQDVDVCSNEKTLGETIDEFVQGTEKPEKQAVDSEPESLSMESYRMYCDSLCEKYIDANFDQREALEYCEKYFEIDLNRNGKIPGEAAKINAFGVCEDRVYCLNIRGCNWGSSENSRLTPERCRDIMCDVYVGRFEDADMASAYIGEKMEFGSCDLYDPVISFEDVDGKAISTASWWIDNFQDVNCSGE